MLLNTLQCTRTVLPTHTNSHTYTNTKEFSDPMVQRLRNPATQLKKNVFYRGFPIL
jgi:hypothetical protein